MVLRERAGLYVIVCVATLSMRRHQRRDADLVMGSYVIPAQGAIELGWNWPEKEQGEGN